MAGGAEMAAANRQQTTNLDVLLPISDRDVASAVTALRGGLTNANVVAHELLKRTITSSELALLWRSIVSTFGGGRLQPRL